MKLNVYTPEGQLYATVSTISVGLYFRYFRDGYTFTPVN